MDRSMNYMGRCITAASLGSEGKALHLGADPIVFCGAEQTEPVPEDGEEQPPQG